MYDRNDSAPVGTAGLLGISHAHGCSEFALALGERRGQGIGTEQPTDVVLMDAVPEDFGASVLG